MDCESSFNIGDFFESANADVIFVAPGEAKRNLGSFEPPPKPVLTGDRLENEKFVRCSICLRIMSSATERLGLSTKLPRVPLLLHPGLTI